MSKGKLVYVRREQMFYDDEDGNWFLPMPKDGVIVSVEMDDGIMWATYKTEESAEENDGGW